MEIYKFEDLLAKYGDQEYTICDPDLGELVKQELRVVPGTRMLAFKVLELERLR